MAEWLVDLALQSRVVLYDELSHLPPLYNLPGEYGVTDKDREVRYHRRNLRLLALYFDKIVVLTGNIMNTPNNTSSSVILSVLESEEFVALTKAGVIVFSGWGSTNPTSMIQNQLAYTLSHPKGPTAKGAIDRAKALMRDSQVVLREPGVGEIGLTEGFLDRVAWIDEQDDFDWTRVVASAQEVDETMRHLASLEFFSALRDFPAHVRKRAHEEYWASWINYTAQHYGPVFTYEPPRLDITPLFETGRRGDNESEKLASLIVGPHFFELFLRSYLSDQQFYKLLSVDIKKILRLRNGDWRVFCHAYHEKLRIASDKVWQLAAVGEGHISTSKEHLSKSALDEVLVGRHSLEDADGLARFLSALSGMLMQMSMAANLSHALISPFSKNIRDYILRIFYSMQMREAEPFLRKLKDCCA